MLFKTGYEYTKIIFNLLVVNKNIVNNLLFGFNG